MTKKEVENIIRSKFIYKNGILLIKDSKKRLTLETLVYLCEKCYEEGFKYSDDISQRKVD